MKGSSDPAESEATRERLLHAASAIFAEVGYEAATTRNICVRAEANSAAVNYHFGDKLGLYTEVLERSVGHNAFLDLERARAMEPALALREFVTRMLQSIFESGLGDQHALLMAHEMAHPSPALERLTERVIRPRLLFLCDLVARITGGPPAALETRLAAHSIIAQIVVYRHSRRILPLLWPDWTMDAERLAAVVDQVVTFSLAGLRGLVPRRVARRVNRKRPGARSTRH